MNLYSVPFRSRKCVRTSTCLSYEVLSQEKVSQITVNLCGIIKPLLLSVNKGTLISNLNVVQYINNYMRKTTQQIYSLMQKKHKLTNPEKKDLPTEENSHYNQSDTLLVTYPIMWLFLLQPQESLLTQDWLRYITPSYLQSILVLNSCLHSFNKLIHPFFPRFV